MRFSQVKPLRQASPSSLSCIETFLQTEGSPHDFYICSSERAPSQWLEKWPQVTWLRLRAKQDQNGKAATLALGQPYWSGEVFVISDADMLCSADYLEAVLGEFSDPEVGVVTCLYRAEPKGSRGVGALLESLCILDFSASILLAERTEGIAFAMGSTMAVRREVLEAIGGFEALIPYLADDFQLGNQAAKKGWKVALAPTVLNTQVGAPSLKEALVHQQRWMLTSRVSRPKGHAAFLITQGLLWSLLLCFHSFKLGWPLLMFWCRLRIALGAKQGSFLKGGESNPAWQALFFPLKDFVYLYLWGASFGAREVTWGDDVLKIDAKGRIQSPSNADGRPA